MAYSHLGHNCELGDRIVIANGVAVAGHVVIGDRAVVGGMLGIHQFVHIGTLAMVGGMSRIDRDVPPFMHRGGPSGSGAGAQSHRLAAAVAWHRWMGASKWMISSGSGA
jgi:acyl-[acyl carrier protein]--UDP-N-acetylglucosamine O-acyltransferase